jgi:hypothetical protein
MSSSASTTADLSLNSLFVGSFVLNLSHHADDPDSSISNLEQRDLILCECLQALLPLHGHDPDAGFYKCRAAGVHAIGASFVLSWSEGVDTMSLPFSMPAPLPALRFITSTRARSSSHDSTGSNSAALEMPALVATLLLHWREGK